MCGLAALLPAEWLAPGFCRPRVFSQSLFSFFRLLFDGGKLEAMQICGFTEESPACDFTQRAPARMVSQLCLVLV